VAPESQDFVIANHFLEHTADPIATVEAHLSKLKPGGILLYAVPDKRYTFDFRRPLTPLAHIVADYEEGPERSRRQHFDEVALLTPDQDYDPDDPASVSAFEAGAESHARHLEEIDYSIHHHVWTQATFLELLLHLRERFDEGFDIEAISRRSLEIVAVLRKNGAWPDPVSTEESPGDAAGQAELDELRRRNELLSAELDGLQHSASWRLTKPLREAKAALARRRRSR
jgi:SAM-dependent methyltransferase